MAAGVGRTIYQRYESTPLQALLVELMARPGRACHDPSAAKWPPIVRRIAAALRSPRALAVQAATVLEFVIGALDIVDDVIDDELPSRLSAARGVNAGLALLALAEAAVEPLAQNLTPSQLKIFHSCIWDAVATAAQGEDMDILFEDASTLDEQAAIDMTARKSGALVGMAFRMAGILHTDNSQVLQALADFGTQVGTISQLDNDLQACTAAGALGISDLRLRKKTLPVAYALQCAAADGNDEFLAYFREGRPGEASLDATTKADTGGLHGATGDSPLDADNGKRASFDDSGRAEQLHDVLETGSSRVGKHASEDRMRTVQRYIASCGGLHYTWVVCETLRREAESKLEELEVLLGKAPVRALRSLIPPLPPMSEPGMDRG